MPDSEYERAGAVSNRGPWLTVLVTLAALVLTVVALLFWLRSELRVECFGCAAASSVSNAPGP